MPFLSVVTPTYNRRASLQRTIAGLCKQTYPADGFEMVIVSDGSTDDTLEALATLSPTLKFRLKVISQNNKGPSVARNKGVSEATGELIVFLDDDVEPVPEFLERHAAHHLKSDNIVILGPMNPEPALAGIEPVWIAWEHDQLQKTYDFFRPGGEYAGQPAAPIHFYSGNVSLRKKWIDKAGGFDSSYSRQEDVELAIRLERICGLKFEFDMDAIGIHRPVRSFESWARIPSSYGKMDAMRLRLGVLTIDEVRKLQKHRNFLTRLFTQVRLSNETANRAGADFLNRLSFFLYSSGAKKAAIDCLSAYYNSTYTVELERQLKQRGDAEH